jgi:NDP-sugar pyrophosphorylase family protein
MSPPKVRKAVIPAAGLGTRFLPATKAIPKEMLPIVDVPALQLIVEEAVASGIDTVVVVNGRGKSAIEDHFDHAYELERTLKDRGKTELLAECERISTMVRMVSVRQKAPLGLGHAVLCGRDAVGDEPFAVLLGDDLLDNDARPGIGQLIEAYEGNSTCTASSPASPTPTAEFASPTWSKSPRPAPRRRAWRSSGAMCFHRMCGSRLPGRRRRSEAKSSSSKACGICSRPAGCTGSFWRGHAMTPGTRSAICAPT